MAVVDAPGSRHGYKSEPGTMPWLAKHYVLVKTLPQGPAETFDIWIRKSRLDEVLTSASSRSLRGSTANADEGTCGYREAKGRSGGSPYRRQSI
jgi:hypothetical protein